jgi:hypothetical protein
MWPRSQDYFSGGDTMRGFAAVILWGMVVAVTVTFGAAQDSILKHRPVGPSLSQAEYESPYAIYLHPGAHGEIPWYDTTSGGALKGLPIGAEGQALVVSSGQPVWGTPTLSGNVNATGNLTINGDTTWTDGDLYLPWEQGSTKGTVYLDGGRFIHSYVGTGDTATPYGRNLFIGKNAGNFSMGDTATKTYHSSYNNAMGYYALYSNTTGSHNSAMGYYALYSNTTGFHNSAMGYYALYSNTTGSRNNAMGDYTLYRNTTGAYNNAMGDYALHSNTFGSQNNAMGYYTLYRNTTGAYNNATGHHALYSNTVGSQNNAMGYYAGKYTSTGVSNTAPTASIYIGSDTRSLNADDDNQIVIGHEAIGHGSDTVTLGNESIITTVLRGAVEADSVTADTIDATTATATAWTDGDLYLPWEQGSTKGTVYLDGERFIHSYVGTGDTATPYGRNLFIGKYAGNFTMGDTATEAYYSSHNIGIGNYVLYNNTTGSCNSGIGYYALRSNTTGLYNSAMGYYALFGNTTGSRNSGIGHYALFSNTTGSYNSAMGTCAGKYTSTGVSNTAPTASIYIGSDTRPLNADDDNQIVIGHEAIGHGSDTVTLGNESITATVLRGVVTGDAFVDGTPGWERSSADALSAVKGVKYVTESVPDSKIGATRTVLDHDSLPVEARATVRYDHVPTGRTIEVEVTDDDTGTTRTETIPETKPVPVVGRDLGAMVTILGEAVKELEARNTALEARVNDLEARIEVLEPESAIRE